LTSSGAPVWRSRCCRPATSTISTAAGALPPQLQGAAASSAASAPVFSVERVT
jgi:hypothetical protein